MVTIYHPTLDREVTVPESTAQVLVASGWIATDDPGDPAVGDPVDETSDPDSDGDTGDPVDDDDTDPNPDSLLED